MQKSMRVEQHILKGNHVLYKKLDNYYFKSKNFYNYYN